MSTRAIVLAALLGAGPASAAPADPGEEARAILAAQGYQTSLPLKAAPPPANRSPSVLPPPDSSGPLPPLVATLAPSVGMVLIGLLLAVGLAWLIARLMPSGERLAAPAPAAGLEPAAPARPLSDAEALAQQGRFAEAIHALLLRALAELGRRRGSVAASPAATSREVLRHAGVPAAVKAALAPLVTAVEWMHFGRAPAGATDYAACAEHYRRFRDAWQASR
jgi:hypothetical protein